MKFFALDLDTLKSVAAAVLNNHSVLLEANAAFLRLLPTACSQPLGAKIARFFIQPDFAALAMAEPASVACYRGLMTIGDPAGKTRTLHGQVWRSATGLRVLAEYDIAELELLNEAMLEINREASVTQQALARSNVALKQREAQIVETSLTDSLTGLGNRRRLDEALEMEISRVRRVGGSLSAIMSDIDHFKRVNDEYGHSGGDRVLQHFGALLKVNTRPTDTLARFGGEEFVVLMPHTSLTQAASKAEQLRVALASELISPLTRPLTSSFGAAELRSGEDAKSFLSRVDSALYEAKKCGRNRVVTASDDLFTEKSCARNQKPRTTRT